MQLFFAFVSAWFQRGVALNASNIFRRRFKKFIQIISVFPIFYIYRFILERKSRLCAYCFLNWKKNQTMCLLFIDLFRYIFLVWCINHFKVIQFIFWTSLYILMLHKGHYIVYMYIFSFFPVIVKKFNLGISKDQPKL